MSSTKVPVKVADVVSINGKTVTVSSVVASVAPVTSKNVYTINNSSITNEDVLILSYTDASGKSTYVAG